MIWRIKKKLIEKRYKKLKLFNGNRFEVIQLSQIWDEKLFDKL